MCDTMTSTEISGYYDVVVVGAGIMGTCTAYELAKRRKYVLLLEQFDFLHRHGSSHGESRIIRVTYPEDYYTHMMSEAYRLWADAERDAGYEVYTRTGQLDLGPKSNASLAAVHSSLKIFSIAHDILTPNQVASRFPMITLPADWLAIYTTQGGILRASKAVSMFLALASKHGAVLRDRAKVTAISTGVDGNQVLVSTSRGSVRCGKCVVAAGPWVTKLVREVAGLDLPVSPIHTTIAYWAVNPDHPGLFDGFPVFLSYGEPLLYGTPSVEYRGMIKVSSHSGTPCDPDTRSVAPDLGHLEECVTPWLEAAFRTNVKSDKPVIAEGCVYSMTPDEDFVLDFVPGMDGKVLVAAGFSGHGFKMGPLVGRVMADLALTGTASGIPLDRFSLSRFSTGSTGNVKDHGAQVQKVGME